MKQFNGIKITLIVGLLVLSCFISFGIFGCGNSSNTNSGGAVDTTPPEVTSKTPEGTNVSVTSNITVTFNEAMHKPSVEAAFTISPNVNGAFTWSGNTVTFNPNADLASGTQYTVTINNTAYDLSGNFLLADYSWKFTTTVSAPANATIHAVFVGINDYPDYSNNDLTYCVKDSTDLRDALKDSTGWLGKANITLINDRDATKTNIQQAITNVKNNADATDMFVFFFSGHGSNSAGHSSLCVWENNDWGYISDTELRDWLTGMPCKIAVYIDCCHSGGLIAKTAVGKVGKIKCYAGAPEYDANFKGTFNIIGANIKGLEELNNIVTVTACKSTQTSQESSSLQNGVFTYYLNQGLGKTSAMGPADADTTGSISVEETFTYLAPLASAYNSGQTAQMSDNYLTAGDNTQELVIKY